MKRIKYVFISMLVFILMFLNLYNVSYASVPVTDENLKSALQKYITYSSNSQISMANNIITITKDGKSYNINYDLTNQPTFTLEVTIPKGISYTDWKKAEDSLKFPLLGYLLVANTQGIEFDTISTYLGMSILSNLTNSSNTNDYVIVDDTSLENGITIEKDPNDTKTIYTSEFGNRVIEYVNALYENKTLVSDSSDGVNSYEWSTERKDITDTSVKLVSTVKVNTNADFTKIKGSDNNISNITGNITEDNEIIVNTPSITPSSPTPKPIQTQQSSQPSTGKLPQTGTTSTLITIIGIVTLISIILGLKMKTYKDIQ